MTNLRVFKRWVSDSLRNSERSIRRYEKTKLPANEFVRGYHSGYKSCLEMVTAYTSEPGELKKLGELSQ
jgi:hypothetical protein